MKIELGGGRSGNRLVTMSIESTGDQLFDLSKGTRSKGEIVPLLHRVAANTANLCARMAQEAVVNRMGEIFNIRYRSSSSRFPSFIQQQVKIAKFAKTSDFPNISAILEIQPQAKSSRSDNPLILDTLELGTMRNPFVGKRLAIPVSEGTREGGVFKGKVKPQYKWKNLGLGKGRNPARAPVAGSEMRERRGKHGKRFVSSHASLFQEQENRVYGKSGIYLVHALDDPNTLYVWQAKDGTRKLLYKVGKPKKMPKMLKFFETARRAIYNSAKDIFNSLVANKGNDKALSGMFKHGKSSDEIPF